MPRKGDYEPWSSKNCRLLMGMEDNDLGGEIDWKDKDRPKEVDDIDAWDEELMAEHVSGIGLPLPRNLILGRPHREEAILVQLKGSVPAAGNCDNKCANSDGIFKSCRTTGLHRGACGNCIWQSKAMDCSHALAAIEAEANRKERLAAAKDKLLTNKSAINSSKRTVKTKAKLAAKAAPAEAPASSESSESERNEPSPRVTKNKRGGGQAGRGSRGGKKTRGKRGGK